MASSSERSTRDANNGVRIIGAPPTQLRDFYHTFLRAPWWGALTFIVFAYVLLNVLFAFAYLAVGGIAHADEGSIRDAFFFSVQTMGTIGYGNMYPLTASANALVVVESVMGLLITAVATGLVFAKFSTQTARVVFTHQAAISPMDSVPTLMIRLGNERSNQIMDAHVRVSMIRTERTKEGMTFYRMHDLVLTRERSPALSRSWTALHPIDSRSPLFGHTPESLKRDEVELLVTLVGADDTSLQPVHARKRYTDEEILWGVRHADILSEIQGELVLDLRKFHDTVETTPTDGFPYPKTHRVERAAVPEATAATTS